jgi:hypothetical protein
VLLVQPPCPPPTRSLRRFNEGNGRMSVQPVVIPPQDATPASTGRARARFDELVALGKQAVESGRIWARIGRLAVQMEQDQDYAALGFDSMGACIMEIELLSGYDRSSIYAYKTLYEEASPNAGETILQMPLGSAQIYRQLPSALQRNPVVQTAARTKPKDFRVTLARDYPQALVETRTRLLLNLDNSVYILWEEFMRICREVSGDPSLTYEQALELYLLAPALQEMRNARNED